MNNCTRTSFLHLFLLLPFNTVKTVEVNRAVSTSDAADKTLNFLHKQNDAPLYKTMKCDNKIRISTEEMLKYNLVRLYYVTDKI